MAEHLSLSALVALALAALAGAQYYPRPDPSYYYPRPPYNPYYPVYAAGGQRPMMVPQERPVWQSGWVNVDAMKEVPRIPIYQTGVQLTEGG